MKYIIDKIYTYGKMIKFSHSIFALPFALTSALWASKIYGVRPDKIFWIIVAMVGARSAAMGFNRFADQQTDAKNPRTAMRELPRRNLSPLEVILFVTVSSLFFILASFKLNSLCFLLSPVALGIIFLYSYTKRFTFFSHLVLGFSMSIAPMGAWLAFSGHFEPTPFFLVGVVMLWGAGFDIIYACQDYEFDRKVGLYSIPQTIGISRALWVSRIFHLGSFILLLFIKVILNLGSIYLVGILLVGILLVYEQSLVRANDLSKVNMAFQTMNGFISVLFFLFSLGDYFFP